MYVCVCVCLLPTTAPTTQITMNVDSPLEYNGLDSITLRVTLSNVVPQFSPGLITVEGTAEIQPAFQEVLEAGRVFLVKFVPTLDEPSDNVTIWVPANATNVGLSIESPPLILYYGACCFVCTHERLLA